jgi:hypothetical protein
LSALKKNQPQIAISSRGMSFRTVKAFCTRLKIPIPPRLMKVSSHSRPIASEAPATGLASFGKKTVKYPTTVTTIAALPIQADFQ